MNAHDPPPVSTMRLNFASCMADNAARFAADVARHVGAALGCEIAVIDDVPWRERERRLYAGEIHLCWICGLPYARESMRPGSRIEALAAPVMAADRYGGEAVYYSDVVVRSAIRADALAGLAGMRIAYNEPNSHSGYNVLCHALDALGAPASFFGQVIESGAHQTSIALLLADLADAAVIDSTVLETERAVRDEVRTQVRVVDTLGPSPMPPWVVSSALPAPIKRALRDALTGMHEDADARAVLARAGVLRFDPVHAQWYEPIGSMARSAARYPLRPTHVAVTAGAGWRLQPA